jgi:hypothetical protein
MTISFTRQGSDYVSEFIADSDFNLHIEGVNEGNVRVYQRTSDEGEYALVRNAIQSTPYGVVYDKGFSASVWPKFIRVVCATEPAMAEVIFS